MSHPVKPSGPPAKRSRVVTLTLRIPTVIGGLLALVVGLVWVFILGIMVGRGQAPESQIPHIAGLMPRVESSAIAPPQITTPQTDTIIPEEDLSYAAALKADTSRRAPERQAPQETRASTPEVRPAAAESRPTPPATPQESFDYVYQVAAYKSAAPCDELVAKLKKSGLKAYTEKSDDKGGPWYKTMVSYRGTPDDVDTLREKLLPHKLTRLILKSKSPVRR